MTEEYFQKELERLKSEHEAIMADANAHKEDFEYFMSRIDEAIAVTKKIAKLSKQHDDFLLQELEKGSLEILQNFINKLFGVGA